MGPRVYIGEKASYMICLKVRRRKKREGKNENKEERERKE